MKMCFDMMLHEIVDEIVSSEIYDYGTEIVEVVQEHKAVQIEIDEMYAQHNYAKDERDAMGRFNESSSRMDRIV